MKAILLLVLSLIFCLAKLEAQKRDTTFYFKGSLAGTNNGFSIIPAFTLGKPAALLEFAMGTKRLSFEPQFRFAIEDGRPWSFIFIYRYKAIMKPKFHFTIGGHIPSFNFATRKMIVNGVDQTVSVARRYLAGELIPTYIISKRLSAGVYFIRGHGFQNDGPQNSIYLALRGMFSKIPISGKMYFDFTPQMFYLKLDDDIGYYANATGTIGLQNFPLSISAIVNKAIESDIPAKEFDWNVSLVYTLEKRFVKR